eukprot:30342-Eustigmatos_ZCMA.PRE.1
MEYAHVCGYDFIAHECVPPLSNQSTDAHICVCVYMRRIHVSESLIGNGCGAYPFSVDDHKQQEREDARHDREDLRQQDRVVHGKVL